MFNTFCRWLDSNRGPLVSEATALPNERQPLPLVVMLHNQELLGSNPTYLCEKVLNTGKFSSTHSKLNTNVQMELVGVAFFHQYISTCPGQAFSGQSL